MLVIPETHTGYVPLAQQVEANGSNPFQSRFESGEAYATGKERPREAATSGVMTDFRGVDMTMIAGVSATEYHREYYYKRRAKMIALLGDRCVECGSTHELQFDHIDPAQKSFDIRDNLTASNPDVLAELAKCQLLCADCHRKKTARDNSGWSHGTLYGYQQMKCRCADCRERKRQLRIRNGQTSGERGRYGRPSSHGEALHYRRGCRCDLCRAANAQAARDLKARS